MYGHTHLVYYKFYQNPFKGFRALGGQNLPFPIILAIAFLVLPYQL